MAIRRVTGAVSPSELIFADANALGATYDGSGTTIERGETFTLPAGGTTAVSNGALRLEALKGDCTITNNGNSTLTNASGVDGTIVMRSGASDFPAFVRNSSLGSMSAPAREDFTGDVSGTVSGTINSNATFPAGHIIQIVNKNFTDSYSHSGVARTWVAVSGFTQTFTPTSSSNKVLVMLSTTISNSNHSEHTAVRVTRDGNSLSSQVGSRLAGLGAQQTMYSNTTNSTRNGTGWYYDSPNTTSQVTYAVWGFSGSDTFRMNAAHTNTDNNTYVMGISNLTLMEIVA